MKKSTLVHAGMAAAFTALMFAPMLAGAEPFVQAGTSAKTFLVALFTPFIGIAVIAFAVYAMVAKMHWALIIEAILGVVGIFGHEQVVSMFRGWVGV